MTGGSPSESLGTVISARDLTRRFGPKVALDDVRFEVGPGELHALLGPNGAGKTTLIRVLLGLLKPSEGSVELLGLDVRRHVTELRDLIGLGEQEYEAPKLFEIGGVYELTLKGWKEKKGGGANGLKFAGMSVSVSSC